MSDVAVAQAFGSAPKLDDLMLAMDVVDTLRHDQRLVERELSAASSDDAMIERLREVYKGQGIEVSDRVLEEGVKALKEKRFSYEPPGPSLGRSLALLWAGRARTGKILLGLFLAGVCVWLAYDFFIARRNEPRKGKRQGKSPSFCPKRSPTAMPALRGKPRPTRRATTRHYAGQLLADGKAALARGDAAGARKAAADMEALLGDLRAEFSLRIINLPGEASAVWREPMINTQARNY